MRTFDCPKAEGPMARDRHGRICGNAWSWCERAENFRNHPLHFKCESTSLMQVCRLYPRDEKGTLGSPASLSGYATLTRPDLIGEGWSHPDS